MRSDSAANAILGFHKADNYNIGFVNNNSFFKIRSDSADQKKDRHGMVNM